MKNKEKRNQERSIKRSKQQANRKHRGTYDSKRKVVRRNVDHPMENAFNNLFNDNVFGFASALMAKNEKK